MYNSDDEVTFIKCVSADRSVVVANALQMTSCDDNLISHGVALSVRPGEETIEKELLTQHDNFTDEVDKESIRDNSTAAGNNQKSNGSLQIIEMKCSVVDNTVEEPTECIKKSSAVMFEYSYDGKHESLVECGSSGRTLKSSRDQRVISCEDDIYGEWDEMDVEENTTMQDDADFEESGMEVEDEDDIQSLNGDEAEDDNSNEKPSRKMKDKDEYSMNDEEKSISSSDETYQSSLSAVKPPKKIRLIGKQTDALNESMTSAQTRSEEVNDCLL